MLKNFIAWLETQPPETEYEYISNTDCLIARFFRATGEPFEKVLGWSYVRPDGSEALISQELTHACASEPLTYGDALARARKIAQ